MKYLFPLLFLSTFLLSSANSIDAKHSGHDILSTKQEALIDKTYTPTKSSDNTELKDLMTGLIFECEIDEQKFSLPYRIYIPENYNPNNKYPLVTFFHGLGEVGNDNLKQLGTSFIFLPKLLNTENLAKYPCIVVAPQCTIEDTWVDTNGIGRIVNSSQTTEARSLRAYRLLEKRIKEEYSIDNDRIYITGVSMGGGAVWDLSSRYTDYAAILPVCGAQVMIDMGKQYINRNVWTFHAKTDEIVDYATTVAMVDAIRSAGGKVKFSSYNVGNHASGWINAYAEDGLLDFMFSSRLGTYNEFINNLPDDTNVLTITTNDTYLGSLTNKKFEVFVKRKQNNLEFSIVGKMENHFANIILSIIHENQTFNYSLDSFFELSNKDKNKGLEVENTPLFLNSKMISKSTLNISYFGSNITRFEFYASIVINGEKSDLQLENKNINNENRHVLRLSY